MDMGNKAIAYRTLFLLVLLTATAIVLSGASQRVARRKIPCETPENVPMWYWAHGRLYGANGNPAVRLWKIGTTRVLGIYSGPSATDVLDNEHPELPANINAKFKPMENEIFADFEICPLEPEKIGVMQAACIVSAKNIVVGR